MRTTERIWYLEYLRILATIAVIVLHVASKNWYAVSFDSYEWQILNVADGAVRWCVPVFIMISGALFLDNEKLLSVEKLYKKYIFRLVVAFVFWSALYAVIKYLRGTTIKAAVTVFVQGPSHLWFIFMIIGLYVVTPFLRKITESEKLTEYFLLITFIMTFLLPRGMALLRILKVPHTTILLQCYNAILDKAAFHFTLGYVGYYVLGHYLSKKDFSRTRQRVFYFLGVAGVVATILLTVWYSAELGKQNVHFYNHMAINTLCATVGLFVFAKYKMGKFVPKERMATIILSVSKCSFGIYLVHMLIRDGLSEIFGMHSLTWNPAIGIPVVSIVIFALSYGVSLVLHKIPIIKKYVV